jgi:hypothetical protein
MPLGSTSLFVLTHFNKAGFKYEQSPKILYTNQTVVRTNRTESVSTNRHIDRASIASITRE